MFNIFRHHVIIRTFSKLIRCYSLARKSHYDVLRLKKNCSDKDIKEAFIKLSKEYHPDKNRDADAQKQFVRIVEAYNVLGKPSSRARYDNTTHDFNTYKPPQYYRPYNNMYNMRSHSPPHSKYDFSHTKSKQTSEEPKDMPYYGIKGIHRVPYYVLLLLCVGIAFVGTVLQAIVIKESYILRRRAALEKSRVLSEELDKVRSAAKENTNEMQTRILMEKIVGSSNPTVATASLGQALATEKK